MGKTRNQDLPSCAHRRKLDFKIFLYPVLIQRNKERRKTGGKERGKERKKRKERGRKRERK